MTGIDRVELAYLTRLLADPVPLFGLVRTALGFVLLDRAGCAGLSARACGDIPLGKTDLLGRITRRGHPDRARAEAEVRRLAVARVGVPGLARMLARHLPAGVSYLNVGHSNLTPRVLRSVRALPAGQVAVLIHDVIPLDHPEFTRAGIPQVFARKMAAVAAHADLVIHSAAATRVATEARLAALGRVPPGLVAPLGVPVAVPAPLPPGLTPPTPYFVILGTIEPRKNHALLLDLWDRIAPAATLVIAGARGWAGPDLLARLDARPPGIVEAPGLTDAQVATLLQGATALLFPSHAEGFGLPALEAAALRTPVVCSDLPVFRDLLGDYPVYLDPSDSYSWMETIMGLAAATGQAGDIRGGKDVATSVSPKIPTWEAHFNRVLTTV
jgi:glycosyltransferase involved in cell wall biosynthesis